MAENRVLSFVLLAAVALAPAAGQSAPRATAVGWGDGEALAYDVRIAGLPAARAAIVLGKGRGRTIVARAVGETVPVVRAFYDMAEEIRTVIDLDGLVPRRSHARRHIRDKRRRTVTRFGRTTRQTVTRGDRVTRRTIAGPRPYDVVTALLLLRALPLRDGFRTSIRVVAGTSLYRASLRVVRREVIALAGERTRRAIRIEGIGRRIAASGAPLPKRKPRPFVIWLADDVTRVPLRMAGETRLGRISAELSRHRAARRPLRIRVARPKVCPAAGVPRGWHRLASRTRCGQAARAPAPGAPAAAAIAATATGLVEIARPAAAHLERHR